MFSYVGDCILDPFLGSGTTTVAAMMLSRNSVGFEVEPSFAALIERRVGESINTSLLKGRWVRRRSLHFRVKVNVNYLEQQSIYA
jgi:DNA modification methylase